MAYCKSNRHKRFQAVHNVMYLVFCKSLKIAPQWPSMRGAVVAFRRTLGIGPILPGNGQTRLWLRDYKATA